MPDAALAKDDPRIIAWDAWTRTPEYANTLQWAAHGEHRKGSLWAAFLQGYETAHHMTSEKRRHDGEWVMIALREFDVERYVADYEFRFDGGQGYTPADHEKVMLVDAITGAIGDIEETLNRERHLLAPVVGAAPIVSSGAAAGETAPHSPATAALGTQEGVRIAEIRKRLDRAIDSDWETGGERIRKGFGGDVEYLLSQAASPARTIEALRAALEEAQAIIVEFQFCNLNRCPSCCGWMCSPNGETDNAHTKGCKIGRFIRALKEHPNG